jgi:hypothetical protein
MTRPPDKYIAAAFWEAHGIAESGVIDEDWLIDRANELQEAATTPPPYDVCPTPTCRAHMPVGKTCGGENCGLKRCTHPRCGTPTTPGACDFAECPRKSI